MSCYITQVFFLFWAALPKPPTENVVLAFVQYYTATSTGTRRIDNTGLKKVCWELEPRSGQMCPRYDVVEVSSLIKLEHIVPVWHRDGQVDVLCE
jgi:hypothetical protein